MEENQTKLLEDSILNICEEMRKKEMRGHLRNQQNEDHKDDKQRYMQQLSVEALRAT